MEEDTNSSGAGSYYTFYPDLSPNEPNQYGEIPNYPDPPPVTSDEINRQTDNTINTQIQPITPPSPVTEAQILNNAIPEPTAVPPVTSAQILGSGIPQESPPPAVTSTDFNANVVQAATLNSGNPSLNGDSNITGGIATGSSSSNPVAGDIPGTGTLARNVLNSGAGNFIGQVLGGFGNGRTPFSQQPSGQVNNGLDFDSGTTNVYDQLNQSDAEGRRVRLRPKPGGVKYVYGNSPLLKPIDNTHGMLWPYQPTITYQQEVDYKSMELTHANQDIYSYHKTPSLKLTVDGEFSVQNQEEGIYAMACIHFLRTVTKMHFGSTDRLKGTPPPVLLFEAYGAYMFNQLPVIVTGFMVGLPKEVDYVPIDMSRVSLPSNNIGEWRDLSSNYLNNRGSGNVIWLPAVFNIQVSLIVQNSATKLRSFNLDQFRNGSLVRQGGWV